MTRRRQIARVMDGSLGGKRAATVTIAGDGR